MNNVVSANITINEVNCLLKSLNKKIAALSKIEKSLNSREKSLDKREQEILKREEIQREYIENKEEIFRKLNKRLTQKEEELERCYERISGDRFEEIE